MPTRIYLNEIFETVAKRYSMTVEELLGRSSKREFVEPRSVAIYLCRHLTSASLQAIADRVGRDHSTVFHGCRKIERQRAVNADLDQLIVAIIAELRALRAA